MSVTLCYGIENVNRARCGAWIRRGNAMMNFLIHETYTYHRIDSAFCVLNSCIYGCRSQCFNMALLYRNFPSMHRVGPYSLQTTVCTCTLFLANFRIPLTIANVSTASMRPSADSKLDPMCYRQTRYPLSYYATGHSSSTMRKTGNWSFAQTVKEIVVILCRFSLF